MVSVTTCTHIVLGAVHRFIGQITDVVLVAGNYRAQYVPTIRTSEPPCEHNRTCAAEKRKAERNQGSMRFGECAHHYEAHAKVQAGVAARSATWLNEETRHSTALELGAGTGLFTRHLVEKGFAKVHATDISASMIAEGAKNQPSVEWSIVDAWRPSWPVPVDRIYSCSLLQWASSPLSVLRGWKALLKPEGRLMATFFIDGTLRELFPVDSSLTALNWCSQKQWLDYFLDAGWRVRRSDTWQDTQLFPSPVAALRSVHLTGAAHTNKASTAELRRALLAYQAAHSTANGEVRLTWKAMQVEAELCGANQSSESSR